MGRLVGKFALVELGQLDDERWVHEKPPFAVRTATIAKAVLKAL
jgi:hypothetical protein